jgi:nucleoside-diphosphate-sugar epimerase
MPHMFIFGLGYSAKRIKRSLERVGWTVSATGREGDFAFEDDEAVRRALAAADAVLSSVPPDGDSDPVLDRYGPLLTHGWLGYLSSTGVYGDTGGAWVDETAPVGGGRRTARAACDGEWLARNARAFRLPGIYGPGRSAFDRVREGRVQRIELPGQVFSRVHADDIAAGVVAALDAPAGAYNLADNLPTSQNAVVAEACRLLGAELPPLVPLDDAGLSPQARAFYAENRRVANGKAKRVLGWRPRFATYREGLADCLRRSSPEAQ